jgi:hypothetical protein
MPIPTPEAGLVISCAYLWRYERQAGQDEGRKDRPSVNNSDFANGPGHGACGSKCELPPHAHDGLDSVCDENKYRT